MTCRFEEEYEGRPYPKSCPTCGLMGKCHKGYEQLKKHTGGYEIVPPPSRADSAFAAAKMQKEKPVRVIETRRRLHLIGFLAELPPIDKYNVIQLDSLVDKIAEILLD